MKTPLIRSTCAALFVSLFMLLDSAAAVAPSLDGGIGGIELCPQSICGAALFVFEYHGLVNGRPRRGWGWIAVTHEDLPTDLGNASLILGGVGELYIGLRRFEVDVKRGILTLIDEKDPVIFDDVFGVELSIDICNFFGQCRTHAFAGELSHETLIPTIEGSLFVDPAP